MAATTTRQPLFVVPPQRNTIASESSAEPHHTKDWHIPRLLFKVKDVSHEGAIKYFNTTNTQLLLQNAVTGVLETLYTHETAPKTQRSITLILRVMDGIAYSTGSDLDPDHKQIHFSLDYIRQLPNDRVSSEILGMIRHEMVHCWQYDGRGTAPGGLIEGIADFVRLTAGYVPPHWKRSGGDRWDAGNDTTAYFLQYLCDRFGGDTVRRVNLGLKEAYSPDLWMAVSGGVSIEILWKEYKSAFGLHPTEGVVQLVPGGAPIAQIMRHRLRKMIFDGSSDATRYLLEFEALIDRIQPETSEMDRKLLLCTSFRNDVLTWYENFCPAMLTYGELKQRLQARW